MDWTWQRWRSRKSQGKVSWMFESIIIRAECEAESRKLYAKVFWGKKGEASKLLYNQITRDVILGVVRSTWKGLRKRYHDTVENLRLLSNLSRILSPIEINILYLLYLFNFFLKQDLATLSEAGFRLEWCSCLRIMSSEITGMHYHLLMITFVFISVGVCKIVNMW